MHDVDGSIFSSFGVAGQPAWVFQSSDGEREVVVGAQSVPDLETRLTSLDAAG